MSKVFEAIKYKLDLDSKSAPRISKAAKNISKSNLDGYEDLLLNALETLILKPQSWKAQSEVIRAIGNIGTKSSLPYLKGLTMKDFDATVLYRDLGFPYACFKTPIIKKLNT